MLENEDVEFSFPERNTCAFPEMIDTSSSSCTNSDVEGMSDVSVSSDGDEGGDVDISFASSDEPVSPEPSQQGILIVFKMLTNIHFILLCT